MGNLLLLLFCFAAGIILRQTGRLPETTSAVLNAFIINIGLPATALGYLHNIEIDRTLAYSALAPWVIFIIGGSLLWVICRAMNLSRQTTGCMVLVGGMSNMAYMGIPMIEAFYGASWMRVGVVMDQLGSYATLSVLGITVARVFAAGPRPDPRDIARRILQFPPFLATIAALMLIDVPYPQWLDNFFTRLAATVAPMALVSVGYQLRLSYLEGRTNQLIVALGYKLLVAPVIALALFVWLLGTGGTVMQVTIFEVAMPPMIGASIVAMENDLDPQLATLLVGLGVLLSFVTLPLWYYMLLAI